jgi:EmrB/QacA subfamily drug resistance transporter
VTQRAEDVLIEDSLDEPAAEAAAALGDTGRSGLHGWIVPAIIGSALFMQSLNSTSVANAMPSIAAALRTEPLRLNLTISMYALGTAMFLPLSGWLADRLGARRVLTAAMLLYALTSSACGLAGNLASLVLFRFLQGCAGAMLSPVGRLVLLRTTPKNELVAAMSVLTVPAMLGPIVGPLLGGAFVTFANWRWIFFFNLPVAIIGIFLVRAFVPNVKEQEVSPIDWTGLVLTGIGLGGIVVGLDSLGKGGLLAPAGIVACFLIGFACLALYWLHAARNENAVVSIKLLRTNTFAASVVGGLFFRLAIGASPFLLAMLLQISFGMSAFRAGLITFISAVGGIVMKTTAPPILYRFGFRNVLIVNAFICAVSIMICSLFTAATPHWLLMILLCIGGFFRSLQMTSLNGIAYADIDQPQMSRATTTAAIAQQIAQSLGLGLAASLIHLSMAWRGETQLNTASVAPAFAIIGAVTLLSLAWLIRLPAAAGSEMTRK